MVKHGRGWKGGADRASLLFWGKKLGFKHRHQVWGDKSLKLIRLAHKRGVPAVVSIWAEDCNHAVLLQRIGKKTVSILDPNGFKAKTRSRRWFDERWNGRVWVVLPGDQPRRHAGAPLILPPGRAFASSAGPFALE